MIDWGWITRELSSGIIEKFRILIEMLITGVHTFVNSLNFHRDVHFSLYKF